ncbi:MAG: 30S ribosomal protein S17 [Chlamydiales bacterium]|nr:30S ribosomal protein S17 [Chlamydiales bacterium]
MDSKQKVREGVVVSNKMNKTVTVRVTRTLQHSRYNKTIKLWKTYYAHTEQNLEIGQQVTIIETRPLSKLKRWRVAEAK